MINLFKLVRYAKKSLEEPDLVFHEEAQTLMGLLRSKGVLPNAVTAGLLLSKSPKRLAAGEVKLSDALKSYLQVVENYGENLEQWNKDSLSALTI